MDRTSDIGRFGHFFYLSKSKKCNLNSPIWCILYLYLCYVCLKFVLFRCKRKLSNFPRTRCLVFVKVGVDQHINCTTFTDVLFFFVSEYSYWLSILSVKSNECCAAYSCFHCVLPNVSIYWLCLCLQGTHYYWQRGWMWKLSIWFFIEKSLESFTFHPLKSVIFSLYCSPVITIDYPLKYPVFILTIKLSSINSHTHIGRVWKCWMG